jgi:AraC-like DNA-binding protein
VPTTSPTDNHGLVRPWEHGRSFHLEGLPPSPQLERVVDRHWIVRWDLRGREPFQQEVLPHPSVNLVIEPHGSWVWGVPTTRDVRLLRGEGWAVGTKFKPGAFTALTGIEASSITDGRVSVEAAFGDDLNRCEVDAAPGALYAVVAEIEARLAPRAHVDDPYPALVADVIQSMRHVGPDARVEHLASMHHVAPRTLQRLFRRYVGVGPKWVLRRLRIHQAAEQLTATSAPRWTELALDLGYYDHAHFIRDFRLVVGRSPAAYAAEAARAREDQNPASGCGSASRSA